MSSLTLHRNWMRAAASTTLGSLVVVAPFLLYWGLEWRPLNTAHSGGQFAFLYLPLFVGGLVLTMCARTRPNWLDGVGLGAVFGLLGAVGASFADRESPGFSGTLVLAIILITVMGALVGAAGGALGSLVSRPFLRDAPPGRLGRIGPWHVGATVAALELVFVGAAAATYL